MIDAQMMLKLRSIAGSGVEALETYLNHRIAGHHSSLEQLMDHPAVLKTQGQIAECRALLVIIHELKKGGI